MALGFHTWTKKSSPYLPSAEVFILQLYLETSLSSLYISFSSVTAENCSSMAPIAKKRQI